MRYTLVSQHDGYSTYTTDDGDEVYIAHGGFPLRFLVEYDFDTVAQWWRRKNIDRWESRQQSVRNEFVDWVRTQVTDPDEADDIRWCESCHSIGTLDDGSTVEDDEWACDSCVQNYYHECNDCDTLTTDSRWTLNDHSICMGCYENSYDYCEDCDGYFHTDDRDDHEHEPEGSRCCESPGMAFTVRNDGSPALANDQRVTVTLAAGVIDNEGINRIMQWLYNENLYDLANIVAEMDATWQTKDGNFTKRLSRAAHKRRKELTTQQTEYAATYGAEYADRWADTIERLKTPPRVLSMIGTIAGEHSRAVDFTLDVTRNLNMSAEEFGHEDSCWWQSYYHGRCALKTNGGYGLRTFDGDGPYANVTGRAWVMPLRQQDNGSLTPTFDALAPDAFVVFNGYGLLSGYNACRIVSYMAGMTYRKVSFTCAPMYVNGDMGYLVAPEAIAENYTDGSLYLTVDQHSDLYQREQAAAAALAAAAAALTAADKEIVNA